MTKLEEELIQDEPTYSNLEEFKAESERKKFLQRYLKSRAKKKSVESKINEWLYKKIQRVKENHDVLSARLTITKRGHLINTPCKTCFQQIGRRTAYVRGKKITGLRRKDGEIDYAKSSYFFYLGNFCTKCGTIENWAPID